MSMAPNPLTACGFMRGPQDAEQRETLRILCEPEGQSWRRSANAEHRAAFEPLPSGGGVDIGANSGPGRPLRKETTLNDRDHRDGAVVLGGRRLADHPPPLGKSGEQ